MTLILSNEEIEKLLPMADCLEAVEASFRDLGAGQAVNRPRSDLYSPTPHAGARHVFKSMEGSLPRLGVTALRLNSDVIRWQSGSGGARKVKAPAANGRWVGLILLFSHETGAPLAILPDGIIQRLRVGATNALAARELAPRDASVYGLLGAGWQAGAQVMAMAMVRELREIRVYSPTPEKRRAFAAEMSERTGVRVIPVDTPLEAVEGAHILGTATNAVTPVIDPDWVAPGVHVTCVKVLEVHPGLVEKCALTVVSTRRWAPDSYIVGRGEDSLRLHDPRAAIGLQPDAVRADEGLDLSTMPDLPDLLSGKVSIPTDPEAATCFINVMGLGTQFAALGDLACRRARAAGLGREIPTEWFLEDVHP